METTNYLNCTRGIKSWLLTMDHKRIAILYLIGISIFFYLVLSGISTIKKWIMVDHTSYIALQQCLIY